VSPPTPPLRVSETDGRVRLTLGALAQGEGGSLQEAADELVRRVLRGRDRVPRERDRPDQPECCADVALLDLVYSLSEIAARGEDIRDHLFGAAETS